MADKIDLVRHITHDELRHKIKVERDADKLERLIFINQIYLGASHAEACRRLCITEATGRAWLKSWNEEGHDGLQRSFGNGRPPRLDDSKMNELKQMLLKGTWLTNEVCHLIKEKFGVSLGYRQVIRILKGFGMHYAKPYPQDYRKPDNAKELLKESLNEALKDKDDCIIGFIDETHPQTTSNSQRFWFFGKQRLVKNTTKYKANTFGFYPVNGKSVIEFKENSKKESVWSFLKDIRLRNPEKPIIAVLDNFQSHISELTRQFALSLGIVLVLLPTYSPDLNPIEQLWRGNKRGLSRIRVKSERSFRENIRSLFGHLSKKKSYLEGFFRDFGSIVDSHL